MAMISTLAINAIDSGIILGMGSANERRRLNTIPSLIGWAHIQDDPCDCVNYDTEGGNDVTTLMIMITSGYGAYFRITGRSLDAHVN